MKSFTFNNQRKPHIYMLQGRMKPPFASLTRNTVKIPGRVGAFLQTTETEPLPITQPIGFKVDDDKHALKLKDELAEWLITDQPMPLQFDDEPGRTYYAIVVNALEDFEKMASLRQGTIQFLCLDPYSYSEEIAQNISRNSTIYNEGTAETYPIFDIDARSQLTRLEIRNNSIQDRAGESPAIILGRTKSVEQEEYEREQLVYHDTMGSTSTWQQANEIDNGVIAGEIGVDADGFYPAKFGEATPPYNWQGPSLVKGIGESLQDFRADIKISNMNNTSDSTGMMAVYFRDGNNNKVANIGFGDAWDNTSQNFGHGQLGLYNSGPREDAYSSYTPAWNDFDGIMRIERIGKVWSFYYAVIDDSGEHVWQHSRSRITDNAGDYIAPVTDVQVAFRVNPGTSATDMHIKEIKIYKINEQGRTQSNSVSYIAKAGDRISINAAEQLVTVNGEERLDIVDIETRYFPLVTGRNQIDITGNANVKARYRRAYK